MNKKIKVIDLLNKIANGEEIPKKIRYNYSSYIFNESDCSIDSLYELKGGRGIGWLEHEDIYLFAEVEILEENTEDIEELPDYNYSIKGN